MFYWSVFEKDILTFAFQYYQFALRSYALYFTHLKILFSEGVCGLQEVKNLCFKPRGNRGTSLDQLTSAISLPLVAFFRGTDHSSWLSNSNLRLSLKL